MRPVPQTLTTLGQLGHYTGAPLNAVRTPPLRWPREGVWGLSRDHTHCGRQMLNGRNMNLHLQAVLKGNKKELVASS